MLGRVLLLSLCVRAAKYTGLYVLYQGVVAPSFPRLAGAQPLSILCTLLSAEAGASLPIPSFMSFGTYEDVGFLENAVQTLPPA